MIGKKVKLKNYNPNYSYYVIYHPAVNDLEIYQKNSETDIYNIELNDLGCTDEMAINIKYLVYSELKLEENPNVANINKNYFENYLSSLETQELYFNQNVVETNNFFDIESGVTVYSSDWRDIYGD